MITMRPDGPLAFVAGSFSKIVCMQRCFYRYFSSIITTTRQTVAAVELLSDGSYRSLKTPVVASVVIKEDEEEVSETEGMIEQ